MDFNKLKELVDSGLSHREIARNINCSQTTIKYWLNKYELKTNKTDKKEKFINCILCGRTIENNINNRSKCNSCVTRIRRYRTKKRAVEFLGGKCVKCGWSGNIAAFEFHHNGSDKDFNIGSANNKSWKIVESELLKCELLCSNCHRIEHSKYDKDVLFMKAVNDYKCGRS